MLSVYSHVQEEIWLLSVVVFLQLIIITITNSIVKHFSICEERVFLQNSLCVVQLSLDKQR